MTLEIEMITEEAIITDPFETAVDSGGTEYEGLCSVCMNSPTCAYPRDPERPVIQCLDLVLYPAEAEEYVVPTKQGPLPYVRRNPEIDRVELYQVTDLD